MNQEFWPIALAPNASEADVDLARRVLLKPNHWLSGPAIAKVESWFMDHYQASKPGLFNSGRSALYLLLKALDLKAGDEVILQGFTCVAVPSPIIWAGGRPIYVDIDSKSLTMDPNKLAQAITKRTRAIIVQHTFGRLADMSAIMKIARAQHILVIEDCAHLLGIPGAGFKGDAAFFSFGRDKAVSCVFGGAAVVRNPRLLRVFEEQYQQLRMPTRAWVLQQLAHLIFVSPLGRSSNRLSTKLLLKFLQTLRIVSFAIQKNEYHGERPKFTPTRLPNALALVLLGQLRALAELNQRRLNLSQVYDLGLPKGVLPVGARQTTWLRYPIFVKDARAILKAARRDGIPLGDWYNAPVAPLRTDIGSVCYAMGQCPKAELAAKQIINLPTHRHIDLEGAQLIVKWLSNHV